MGRRTKGTKGRYIVHANRNFTKRVISKDGFFRLFNSNKHYKKGQIIDNVDKWRSIRQDAKHKSKRKMKPGYGHLGDLVVKKRRRDGVTQRYHTTIKKRLMKTLHWKGGAAVCDTCGRGITERQYRRGKGLCYDCVMAI